jgi:hypothetical protein
MTWTSHGVEQLGSLPEIDGERPLPDPMPPLWYVEPQYKLDRAAFLELVKLVRSDRVPGLSLRGQPVAPWLAALESLPDLTALVLDDTPVDGAALAAVQLSLTRLHLAATAVDDAAIAAAVERWPGLQGLDLQNTAVGDTAARAIARLARLTQLNLAGTQISDAGGAALGALSGLAIADLGRTRVGAATVAALRQLAVHELFLDHTKVRGEVAALAPLAPGLVRFDISGTAHHPTDQELDWLAAATNLVELAASGARIHDPLAIALARLPALRDLRLADTAIGPAAIRAIAARRDLETVDLAGTPVDDASAARLIGSPEIRLARLDATPIGDAALGGAPGPRLVELYVSRTAVGDRGLAIVERMPQLIGLGVGRTRISDAALDRIAELTALRTLILSSAGVSSRALTKLGRLASLEQLYLDQTRADDAAIAALAPARASLRVLHLAGSLISEDGLAALRELGELSELTLGDTALHGGIADLSAWPQLRTLSLVGLDLTDRALPGLAAQRSLVTLDLSATDVHDPSPLAALPRLRTLGLAQTRLSPAGVAAAKQLVARGVEVVQ